MPSTNSLTQAYLNYHRVEAVNNVDVDRGNNNDFGGTYQPNFQNRVSMQELCRQQLQENLRNDQERRQARTITKQGVE